MINCKNCKYEGCAQRGTDFQKVRCDGYTPVTHADCIRAKNDEELARWIWAVQSQIKHDDIVSTSGWLDWLKQEATDGETAL